VVKKLSLNEIKTKLQNRFKNDKFTTLNSIPHPETFKDIQKATNRIIKAVKNKEKIVLIGDYDVDGIISTIIMLDFFKYGLNYELEYIIPNRFSDGYGISKKIVEKIEADLIITVDNGISAIEAANECKKRGIDLIITDHHTPSSVLPQAYAIINPKQNDCKFEFSDICGAQVAWYLCASIKKELKLNFNLTLFFDLLAIAIVADIMPMVSINRVFVKKGLEILNTTNRVSLISIKDRFMLYDNITEDDIGYKIAPLLNASGRLEDASISVEFLKSNDFLDANEKLDYLVELNEFRKIEQNNIFNEAKQKIDEGELIIVESENWNEGIIGIVAAKLCETYKKPAFVFSKIGNIYKGSCRNNNEVNLYELISYVKEYLEGFGGHKGAAGLSIKEENFEKFKTNILKVYNEKFDKNLKKFNQEIFCEIDLDLVDKDLYELINSFRPFGLLNPTPLFLIKDVKVVNIELIGRNKEYKKILVEKNGVFKEVLIFNQSKIKLNDIISFIGFIGKNEFRDNINYYINLKEVVYEK